MKLLVVTPWPLSTPGGGQRLAEGVAASLASDRGVDVVVAAGSGAPGLPPVPERTSPMREIRLPLVCHPHVNGRRSQPNLLTTTCLRGLEAVVEETRPQAILYTPHCSSCGHQAAASAANLGIPLLLWPAIHLDQPLHTNRAAQRFYRSAALVLCLSDIERHWLISRAGLSPRRVLTLGFGWKEGATRRGRCGVPQQPVSLLTVGSYVRHKRLDHQIESLAVLRRVFHVDARLMIAGALREAAVLEGLRHAARRHQVEDSVVFVTDCSDSTIAELHRSSDYFLFTSESESFGVAVLEAIGFGTVPIVYPHPVYCSLIESSGFGLIARRSSPKALAEAVVAALNVRPVLLDERRLRWLRERSWRNVAAPLAERLADLSSHEWRRVRESSTEHV